MNCLFAIVMLILMWLAWQKQGTTNKNIELVLFINIKHMLYLYLKTNENGTKHIFAIEISNICELGPPPGYKKLCFEHAMSVFGINEYLQNYCFFMLSKICEHLLTHLTAMYIFIASQKNTVINYTIQCTNFSIYPLKRTKHFLWSKMANLVLK